MPSGSRRRNRRQSPPWNLSSRRLFPRSPSSRRSSVRRLWLAASKEFDPGEPQGNGFVVQVASLKSRGEADAIAKRLSSKGFPSFVTTPGSSGPKVFRVRVGKYADRREAETVARKLEKEEQFKPWITR